MKFTRPLLFTYLLSTLLAGCGGGSTKPLTINDFNSNQIDCNKTNSCTPNTGGTGGTTASGITTANYKQVATLFTNQVDSLNRLRTADSPPTLAALSIQLLQKHNVPSTKICTGDSNPDPITDNPDLTFTIQHCLIQAGVNVFILDGTITASNFVNNSGTINSPSTQWSASADFSSNLNILLDATNPDTDLTFNGQFTVAATKTNSLTTTLTATNLDIQDGLNGTTDTYPAGDGADLALVNSANPNGLQHSLSITGSYTSSVTSSSLDVSTPQALAWTNGFSNPGFDPSGLLTISDATSTTLTLQAFDDASMTIGLSGGTTSTTSW